MVSKEVVDAERGIGDKSVMVAESETEGTPETGESGIKTISPRAGGGGL